jgi:hypothetical protein
MWLLNQPWNCRSKAAIAHLALPEFVTHVPVSQTLDRQFLLIPSPEVVSCDFLDDIRTDPPLLISNTLPGAPTLTTTSSKKVVAGLVWSNLSHLISQFVMRTSPACRNTPGSHCRRRFKRVSSWFFFFTDLHVSQ